MPDIAFSEGEASPSLWPLRAHLAGIHSVAPCGGLRFPLMRGCGPRNAPTIL
jgi:hypothetical protein